MSTSVAVAGATGRLGSLICQVIEKHPEFELHTQISSKSPEDAGAEAKIFVDVTNPESSPEIVERALRRGQLVLVGTSGWSQQRLQWLEQLIAECPGASAIVVPNFSIGSVLGTVLAQMAAPFFGSVEILETHHPEKVDSPSGTAVRTAELVAEAQQGAQTDAPFAEQEARGQLVAGVPVHSMRLAGVLAQQEVRFGGVGETLTITHQTQSNESYRDGIRAALEALRTNQGLTVGLESILGVGK